MNKKLLSMLSLSQRAGKIVSGEVGVENALKTGAAFLVIVAADSSANTKKKFQQKAFYYKTDLYVCSDKAELGHAIGKDYRSVLAVCDINFAGKIKELIESLSAQNK